MAEKMVETKASHDAILEASRNKLIKDLDEAHAAHKIYGIDIKETNFNGKIDLLRAEWHYKVLERTAKVNDAIDEAEKAIFTFT